MQDAIEALSSLVKSDDLHKFFLSLLKKFDLFNALEESNKLCEDDTENADKKEENKETSTAVKIQERYACILIYQRIYLTFYFPFHFIFFQIYFHVLWMRIETSNNEMSLLTWLNVSGRGGYVCNEQSRATPIQWLLWWNFVFCSSWEQPNWTILCWTWIYPIVGYQIM